MKAGRMNWTRTAEFLKTLRNIITMLSANTNNQQELIFEQDATRKQLAERPPCTDEQDDERSIMNTGNNNNHSSTSSSCNDPFRFQGEGVSFKGKLIGVRDVDSARGDVMCSEAMRLAKASIKASGQHKQRIVLNISIEGLKIKDEKTLVCVCLCLRLSFVPFCCTFSLYASLPSPLYTTSRCLEFRLSPVIQLMRVLLASSMEVLITRTNFMGGDASTTEGDKNGDQVGNKVDNNVAVADLLDLESELFNLEQGVEQLQSIPTFCEDYQTNGCNNYANSDDQWPVPCNNQQQLNAFASDNITDQMNVQNSFNERLALSSNNTANQLNGIHMINPFSDNYYSYNTSNNVASTPGNFQQQQQQSNNNNGTNNQLMDSQFNDFHKPRQQFSTVHSAPNFETNAFSETNPFLNSTNQKFELPSQTQPDPFDTQKAQSIIEFINNKSKQQNQFNNTFNSNSTSFADFDNENKMTRSPCKSKPDTNHPKVTTLEEAFTKLVDMDSLMKQSSHSSDIVNSKSNVTNTNPFSVILSPPKVPLSAMPSSYNPSPLINTSTVASSHQAIPYSASAPFVSSLQSNTAITNNDPFNDAFFR
ncbi:unnamed protein product [Anisakis simplex]|uniref:Protein disabled (inferred by orthology to a D. melanogaster protein) n=1 Tax=Anisakis simplex TaxID=6269 RepID=A0A0M3K6M0_ANISI|nr:unnamed protein product [Anisakis simplex]